MRHMQTVIDGHPDENGDTNCLDGSEREASHSKEETHQRDNNQNDGQHGVQGDQKVLGEHQNDSEDRPVGQGPRLRVENLIQNK